jgi:hypothetical protein
MHAQDCAGRCGHDHAGPVWRAVDQQLPLGLLRRLLCILLCCPVGPLLPRCQGRPCARWPGGFNLSKLSERAHAAFPARYCKLCAPAHAVGSHKFCFPELRAHGHIKAMWDRWPCKYPNYPDKFWYFPPLAFSSPCDLLLSCCTCIMAPLAFVHPYHFHCMLGKLPTYGAPEMSGRC